MEQPDTRELEVWDGRKGLEESAMLRATGLEIRNNEIVRPEGRSKDPQATFRAGKFFAQITARKAATTLHHPSFELPVVKASPQQVEMLL